jgi:hypothetical protein
VVLRGDEADLDDSLALEQTGDLGAGQGHVVEGPETVLLDRGILPE